MQTDRKGIIMDKNNIFHVSKLGFGLMRLPEKEGEVDYEHVCRMIDSAMDAGLNYFDTAYVYHSGRSEVAARECLVKRYPRDSFQLATKLPAWCLKTKDDRDRIFDEQLERAGVDYFDFYLLHSLEDGSNYDTYEALDCFRWAMEKKEAGQIRHFGFSYHGTPELLEVVLDKHPEVEFVQIQLNYADWKNPLVQSGALYEILRSRNIPMIIMEPVKGGTLASLMPELEEKLRAARPEASIASWAMRFVGSLPGIVTILSGMSNDEQMADNLRTFSQFEPLSDAEKALIGEVNEVMFNSPLIGCTACRYCCDGCPSGINIPEIFRILNTIRLYGEEWRSANFYGGLTANGGKAKDCIGCGQCESVCPQHLSIIELLAEASGHLDK
ncbi:MAG: aldo/keto reductase [Oscillospiraceae bacterium]|nr:aldo/keto reductase [Oscillospiraceae bacterium]